ncbi:hypothetical protein WH390_07775 [Candidatus Arsenophonus nilaparvatae]|uniref:hypothetical protein n=1 Tax=Candidatus Arsenophonus nilaparvatae TaxID=1247023 RepID=UPI0005096ADF|nr:hypothetical protein [Candidatus Arsenophonus nilaparvatae]
MNISPICPSSFKSISSVESLSKNDKDEASLARNIDKVISNKHIRFDNIPVTYLFNAKKEDNSGSELSLYQKEYRRAVDKQAKIYGLRVAFGHGDPAKDPYPYNHEVGLRNMVKCSIT